MLLTFRPSRCSPGLDELLRSLDGDDFAGDVASKQSVLCPWLGLHLQSWMEIVKDYAGTPKSVGRTLAGFRDHTGILCSFVSQSKRSSAEHMKVPSAETDEVLMAPPSFLSAGACPEGVEVPEGLELEAAEFAAGLDPPLASAAAASTSKAFPCVATKT